jgi:hypothetical protein
VTPALRIGGHVIGATGSPLRGDEANLERPLDGYVRFDLDATLRLGRVEIFGAVRNVLDASYETFGLYGEAQELGYDDSRFLSPAAPRALLVGIRASYGRGD